MDFTLHISLQREISCYCGRNPADVKNIKQWYETLKETGSVADIPRSTAKR